MKTKKIFFRVFLFLSLISLFPLQSIAYAADIAGTAVITGTAIYGQQLTASVQDGESNVGPYQYQWMRDETPVGTPSATATYDIAVEDIGHYIYVIITSLGDTGSLTSAQTATVEKADCETDPIEAPVLDPGIDITDTTVTLTAVADYEYIIVADDATELPEVDWQDSEVFTGLTPNTAYDVYQRVKETTTHKASAASVKLDVATIPSVLSGTITISGSAVFGQTLTATETTNNSGTISYQWLRGASPIASATLATYELVQADIGQQISVEITSSIETGSLTSDATAVVQKAASSPTKGIAPVFADANDTAITVTAVTGYEYLIAADGTAVLPDTWQDSNVFTGLTASTPYDIYQRVKETDTHNASETSDRLDASTTAEALSGTVTISGSAVFGQTLTATPSTNNTGTLSYQWMRDDVDITSATGSTYELVEADVGTQISIKITSSVQTGTLTSTATTAVEKADCEVTPVVTPVLSSKTADSITVTTVSGYEYKIVADGADSSGGTWQSTNVFNGLSSNTAYDIYQRVKETTTHKASDISGKLDVTTEVGALTGTAQITGTLQYGEQLTASLAGGNNTGTLSYQWMRGGTDISSATGNKYTLVLGDIGQKISVKISSSVETGTITSAQTAVVEKADNPVSVVETPELQSKTSSTITLVNKEFYEYMIVANDASYLTGTWQSSNVFSGLSAGTQYDFYERVTETAVQKPSAVSSKLDVTTDGVTLTGTASISGTATYGSTLTASLSSSNNTGTLSYQWVRGTSDIPSATSSTYVLSSSDVGQKIKVRISSSVEAGTVTSAQTAAVQKAESSVSKGILPVLSDRSRHTVTVTARTGYEYMIVRSGYSYTTGTWQTGNVFTDLNSDTAYDVYQRVKETSTRKASAVSDKLDVNTRAYSSSSSSSTATPTPKPSASATPTPTITLAPTPSPTAAPTATATPVKVTVTPAKINEDKASGTITLEINVSDLPKGTKSIRTSDDKVITVSGTNTVYVTINKADINEDGTIELVTLDEEGVALGYMAIDASEVTETPEKSDGIPSFVWIIIALGAILAFVGVVYIIGRIRIRGKYGY